MRQIKCAELMKCIREYLNFIYGRIEIAGEYLGYFLKIFQYIIMQYLYF